MDLAFEQLLAEHNQAFKDSEVYSTWMPDDGEYIVSLVKFDAGQKVEDGDKTAWYKLTGRIEDVQDEKLNGREFLVNWYRSSAYGILKGDARILSGNPDLDDLKEAYEVLEASINTVVRLKVRTSISKKNGKEYTNCFILEVINTTTEAPAETVTVQDDSNVAVANGDAVAVEPAGADIQPDGITEEDPAEIPVTEVPAEVPAEVPPVV